METDSESSLFMSLMGSVGGGVFVFVWERKERGLIISFTQKIVNLGVCVSSKELPLCQYGLIISFNICLILVSIDAKQSPFLYDPYHIKSEYVGRRGNSSLRHPLSFVIVFSQF